MIDLGQFDIDRRALLGGGAAGAALWLPSRLRAAPAAGFTHGVASGTPRPDSVMLWTRYIGPGNTAELKVEIAEDSGFRRVAARGSAMATASNDFTAKTTLAGLVPGKRYYYRFTAPGGAVSPVGRTATLPVGKTRGFKVAVFSCSNLGFGYFNGYGHAAARDDIDLVIHVGDYIYEYARGTYPSLDELVAGRAIHPDSEIVTVDDYRARYASYRTDPDLQALHARAPWIAIWDDHELANDAWMNGAQNHDPVTEGDWAKRKAAARQAHNEWLPITGKPYESFDAGDLVTIVALDTRAEGRDQQFNLGKIAQGAADPKAAITAFRDGQWSDGGRQLLGSAQESWAAGEFARSVKAGTAWQLAAQQVVMGSLLLPPAARGWLRPNAPAFAKGFVEVGVLAGSIGVPGNQDSWGGYPAARTRFLKSAQAAGANLVVVSGDSHNAWAFDLAEGGKPAGVEFAGTSISSPGLESAFGAPPEQIAAALAGASPELKWCDTSRRGYLTVAFTPQSADCEWIFTGPAAKRSPAATGTQRASTKRGTNRLTIA